VTFHPVSAEPDEEGNRHGREHAFELRIPALFFPEALSEAAFALSDVSRTDIAPQGSARVEEFLTEFGEGYCGQAASDFWGVPPPYIAQIATRTQRRNAINKTTQHSEQRSNNTNIKSLRNALFISFVCLFVIM
jgi:hypothetical protein